MVFRSMPSALIEANRTTPPLLPSRRMASDIAAQQNTENINKSRKISQKQEVRILNHLTI